MGRWPATRAKGVCRRVVLRRRAPEAKCPLLVLTLVSVSVLLLHVTSTAPELRGAQSSTTWLSSPYLPVSITYTDGMILSSGRCATSTNDTVAGRHARPHSARGPPDTLQDGVERDTHTLVPRKPSEIVSSCRRAHQSSLPMLPVVGPRHPPWHFAIFFPLPALGPPGVRATSSHPRP